MIVSEDTNPQRQIYYIGSITLDLLKNSENGVDFFESFQKIKKDLNISLKLYALSLDWLFMLGIIEQKNGRLSKCS